MPLCVSDRACSIALTPPHQIHSPSLQHTNPIKEQAWAKGHMPTVLFVMFMMAFFVAAGVEVCGFSRRPYVCPIAHMVEALSSMLSSHTLIIPPSITPNQDTHTHTHSPLTHTPLPTKQELFKYLALRFCTLGGGQPRSPHAILIYLVAAAAGFACCENVCMWIGAMALSSL